MPPTTAMKAIALPGEGRAMSKSLRSDGCGSGVTSERQCGQSLASSRMGSAQNGHKRLPRWLSADFERGVGSAKIRTQAISGEISIARKNQPKPLRPLASAINPTASAKMNQNTSAVSIPGTPLLPVVGVTLNLEWASAQGYRLLLKFPPLCGGHLSISGFQCGGRGRGPSRHLRRLPSKTPSGGWVREHLPPGVSRTSAKPA